ncbi:hypothetical protein C8F04DRAFT_1389238 [Mycena alexandri]|uniref:Uncharacterized protein n=1 Tax=Mycena alexandri TaxID=1745969 RepID=A0AAD6TDE0_9AGAR|nr:hypothetical protein C8F04DRAFT_1389238 [Mycena alexandri]
MDGPSHYLVLALYVLRHVDETYEGGRADLHFIFAEFGTRRFILLSLVGVSASAVSFARMWGTGACRRLTIWEDLDFWTARSRRLVLITKPNGGTHLLPPPAWHTHASPPRVSSRLRGNWGVGDIASLGARAHFAFVVLARCYSWALALLESCSGMRYTARPTSIWALDAKSGFFLMREAQPPLTPTPRVNTARHLVVPRAPAAPFGVHRMALAGKAAVKDVGMSFAPSAAAGALRACAIPCQYDLRPKPTPGALLCHERDIAPPPAQVAHYPGLPAA